jgi:hypothetical protein
MLQRLWYQRNHFAAGTNAAAIFVAAALFVATFAVLEINKAPDAMWTVSDALRFSPADPPSVQQRWPTVGTTAGVGAAFTAGLARATAAAGLTDTGTPIVAGAALSVLVLFVIGRTLGWSLLAAAAAALLMAFSGVFWSLAAGARPATYAAGLALATIGALLWWKDSGRRAALALLVISYGLTIAIRPPALMALPVILLAMWTAGATARQRAAGTVAAMMAAAAAAVALWRTVGGPGPLSAWFVADPSQLASRLRQLTLGAVTDLGALGLAFFVLGMVVLLRRRPWMLLLCAGWMLAVAGGTLVFAPSDLRGLPALAPTWLVIGAGMNAVHASRSLARCMSVAFVVMLPLVGAAEHFTVGAQERGTTTFVDEFLGRLQVLIPSTAVVVAEGAVLDGQIDVRSETSRWRRIPQDPAVIRRALAAGVPVVSFPGARANLRELGFRFAPIPSAGVALSVDEYLEAIPEGWTVAAATGDRFALSVRPRRGPTFAALGGVRDLFSRVRSHYTIVGLRGGRDVPLEVEDTEPVRLDVRAGDKVSDRARAPASLTAASGEDGGTVSYRGTPVAHTDTGLALAVVSPNGVLRDAVSVEYSRDMRILVNPPGLAPAFVVGSEPCARVEAGAWADVSAVAQLASLGGLLDGRTHLVIYARSQHPLAPTPRALPHHQVPQLDVKAFVPSDSAGRKALAALMTADRMANPQRWLDAPYVYRIVVDAASAGRRQLALGLGGFATAAIARLESGSGAGVTLCAAERSRTVALASRPLPADGQVDINNRDLFVFGWDRVEGRALDPFRWTRTLEAELLVPVTEAAPMVLELDCVPPTDGIELTAAVNGQSLAPVVLAQGRHRYRWALPMAALVGGLNRVSIRTDRLVRPTDLGAGTDDRRLGVAVHRIVLGRQAGS